MATAVMELYPGTKISIGPPIENGFYYDFEFPEGVKVSDEDLAGIEERMREHVAADEPFERTDLPVDEALRRFEGEGQDYKVELIRDLVANEGVETVSLYRNGPFTDLCRGPHGPSTGRIKAFKLLSLAGAYWRGDERNKMLTRIYGTAFLSKKDLERHLEMLEQARARDHRRLGPQLGLFVLRDRRRRACRSTCRTGWSSSTRSSAWYASSSNAAATTRSARRRCSTSSCGSAPATGTTTARTCSSRESGDEDGAVRRSSR